MSSESRKHVLRDRITESEKVREREMLLLSELGLYSWYVGRREGFTISVHNEIRVIRWLAGHES